MPLPTHSNVQRSAGSGLRAGSGTSPFRDPSNFNVVFLGAFRRDLQSFYPGSSIEREPAVSLAGTTPPAALASASVALDFQLDQETENSRRSVRVALFGVWYRFSVPGSLGLGPRDHDLIRAVGRVMELHHQVLFRWSRVSLLQLRRGMPEDHYVAAAVDPSAYSIAAVGTQPDRRGDSDTANHGPLHLREPPGHDRNAHPGRRLLWARGLTARDPGRVFRPSHFRHRVDRAEDASSAMRRPQNTFSRGPAGMPDRSGGHPPVGHAAGQRSCSVVARTQDRG